LPDASFAHFVFPVWTSNTSPSFSSPSPLRRVDLRKSLLPPLVLAYHGVGRPTADDRWGLFIEPERLSDHVLALKRLGYRFVTAEQLVDESRGGRPPHATAALTFDDGWLNGLTVAAPLLTKLGVRATFYVNPGSWGAVHHDIRGPAGQLLDRAQTRMLSDYGMAIGAHGMTHVDLRGLADADLEADLRCCRREIEAATGTRCRTFAYPYGAWDERVAAAVAKAGYALAFAWERGPWRAFAAPRLPVGVSHGAIRLVLGAAGLRRRRTVGPAPQPDPSD
jgi:peptidoglycan/xylan/chitin deacetylase (PgdA/CDA1 family)